MEINDLGNQIAPPEVLLRFAQEEEPRRVLDDYAQVIHTLRDKNFTFREIAEWLQGHGFDVDHNAVWRAYAKTVPDVEAHLAAEADDQLEEDEHRREAILNGTTVSAFSTPATVVPEPADQTSVKASGAKASKKNRSGGCGRKPRKK